MVPLKWSACFAALFGMVASAHAEPPRSTISIESSVATVTTTAGQKVASKDFVDRWLKSLSASGFINSVVLTERGDPTIHEAGGVKTTTVKRHLFAELRFVERVAPVLFELTETTTDCDPARADEWDEEDGCTNQVKVELTGPLASYEHTTPFDSIEMLLGGKQRLTWTYDADAKKMTGKFEVTSLQFERSVMRILENRFLRVVKAYDLKVDQNFILVGTSRLLREVNEGVLK